MSSFSIRSATPDDVPVILDLVQELADYEKEPEAARATREDMREALFGASRAAEAVMATIEGSPIGFALFFHNFSTWTGKKGLYLEDLYIKPAFRGRGYGKALLCHLASLARERNCGRFEWSVLDWNKPAIDFYESLGAKPMKGWTVYRLDRRGLEKLR